MKNRITGIISLNLLWVLWILILSCTKGGVSSPPAPKTDTMSITFVFKETKKQIIHFHRVWDSYPDSFLTRYLGQPRYTELECNLGWQEIIIEQKCSSSCKK